MQKLIAILCLSLAFTGCLKKKPVAATKDTETLQSTSVAQKVGRFALEGKGGKRAVIEYAMDIFGTPDGDYTHLVWSTKVISSDFPPDNVTPDESLILENERVRCPCYVFANKDMRIEFADGTGFDSIKRLAYFGYEAVVLADEEAPAADQAATTLKSVFRNGRTRVDFELDFDAQTKTGQLRAEGITTNLIAVESDLRDGSVPKCPCQILADASDPATFKYLLTVETSFDPNSPPKVTMHVYQGNSVD
jgi:hypothetical protein